MALPLAGVLTTVLAGMLASALARVFVGAGIAFLTYQGISSYVESYLLEWSSTMSNLPAAMLTILTIAGLPSAIGIVGSAMLTVTVLVLSSRVMGIRIVN